QLLDSCAEQFRNWEWHYLKRLCHGSVLTLRGLERGTCNIALSPDGNRLASWDTKGVHIWDARTGELLDTRTSAQPIQTRMNAHRLAFSPDGKRLAAAWEGNTVKVWDLAGGKDALTLRGHKSPVLAVAFSPDGTRVATGSGREKDAATELRVWDAATGELVY